MGLKGILKLQLNQASYFAWALASEEGRRSTQLLQSLKNRYAGRRCFIMGNGPSLLKCDLSLLRNEITIVSNANFLIWDKLKYTPNFLTVEDPLVAEDRSDDLRRLSGIMKIYPFDLRKKLLDNSNSTSYINFLRTYNGFPKFSSDISRSAFWGGTVSYLNLQLAAYLGCKKIILVGFDHSYKVPTSQIVDNVITSTEADINHIHPQYFGPGYRWHDPNVARMETGYIHAREALKHQGIDVINATEGGMLEVFPRIQYNSLFQ